MKIKHQISFIMSNGLVLLSENDSWERTSRCELFYHVLCAPRYSNRDRSLLFYFK
jgi:hypothetical protein